MMTSQTVAWELSAARWFVGRVNDDGGRGGNQKGRESREDKQSANDAVSQAQEAEMS